MSEEVLKESKKKEMPYSPTPVTACAKSGRHVGLILDRCKKCGQMLLFQDFELKVAPSLQNGKLHIIKCIVCGASREVKPQDLFQVKRCKPCQAKRSGKRFKKFMAKVGRK